MPTEQNKKCMICPDINLKTNHTTIFFAIFNAYFCTSVFYNNLRIKCNYTCKSENNTKQKTYTLLHLH